MFGGRKPPTPGSPPHQTQTIPSVGASNSAMPSASSTQPLRPQAVGFETALGANTALKGELKSRANVRIDGTFEGNIEVDGNVMIGETARISADIHAHNISIAGAVHGNVTAQKIQLLHSGRVWGDLSAATIVTEDGAFIDGQITMNSHPAAKGIDMQDDPHALPPPEMALMRTTAEDALSGEPVEVEMVEDQAPTDSLGA